MLDNDYVYCVYQWRGLELVTLNRISSYLNKFSSWLSRVELHSVHPPPTFLFRARSSLESLLAPAPDRSFPYVFHFLSACVRDCGCVRACVCVCVRDLRRSVNCVPYSRVWSERSHFVPCTKTPLVVLGFPSRLQPVLPSQRIGFSVFPDVVGVVCTSNNTMACATLKRSLDFEPPMCRPTKRQRCTPMSISPSSSPPNSSRSEYVSPHFGGDVVPKITAGKENFLSRKRQLNRLWLLLLLLLWQCRWRCHLL